MIKYTFHNIENLKMVKCCTEVLVKTIALILAWPLENVAENI